MIWGRIYESYFREELTYEVIEWSSDIITDASY